MLAYQMKGEGTPLVLLHAFPLSSKMWLGELEPLSSRFKVIVPDLPGFGKSPVQKAVSMADMALKTSQLLDSLKVKEPVVLAGLSMGGYVSFEFLRQFPKRVRALGLFATRASDDTPQAREKRMQSIEALEKFGMEPFTKKIVKSQLGKSTHDSKPEVVKQALAIMNETNPEGAVAALRAMAVRRDSTDLLSSINFPVLIAAGEEDEIAPAAEMRAMHEKIRGSEFHVLPKAAHLINLEQPAEFRRIFEAFLKKL